jgi:ribose/xylose/arabinose/galactoside ABC-type transport system permease subunit
MNRKGIFFSRNLPIFVTIGLFILMFGGGSIVFPNFLSFQVFFNLLIDNAYLVILGAGMTFVIISGGIDLSVGSMLGFTTMLSASLLEKQHMSPLLVIPIVLAIGTTLGLFMGYLIQTFNLPPFIITLGGLYLGRGLCYIISLDSISITDGFYKAVSEFHINIFDNFISMNVAIAAVVVLAGIYIARYTRFGRTVFAIGGNEQSAILMGLPVARTKILIYAVSGLCSALAGVVFTFYLVSGYALNGKGMELDTIAAVVIGGTLLTGGVGNILGTVFGVLVLGTIQVLIQFQGQINSWWTRIIIGILIFLFCLSQRIIETGRIGKGVKERITKRVTETDT